MLLARLGLELAVVEFDDLAFLNVGGQFVALRQTEEGAGELLGVHFDVADGSGLGIEGFLHHLEGAVAFEGDDVVDGAKVGRDIDLLAIDEDMAVVDELAGAGASAGEAHAIDEVVETGLEDAEEGEAGNGFLVGFGDEEQAAELTLNATIKHILFRNDKTAKSYRCKVFLPDKSLCLFHIRAMPKVCRTRR